MPTDATVKNPAAALAAPAHLTDLLNYRLARLVAASGAPVIRLCEGKYGVSRREWHLLGLLAAFGPLAPSELADRCHLDRTRVSRAITQMSGKGLIRRLGVPGDQRRARVELTDQGRALHAAMFGDIAAINSELVRGFTAEQLAVLDGMLNALTTRAEQVRQQFDTSISTNRWRGGAARPRWPREE
ncbi:DNA-binding MarR family transcriptional regulator [Cupriavidus gilardii J11]|uniref:DNA-binding MarR family transcriptional regulator n=1 Tax=Cupriavidus gilardii J11 TaxID=936133 RepID=A0A562B9I9_9BURK|nr:MarR family transcriptional regulator [Cupriavidus gilardii]TWG81851.1 DNA-binding MarR family transcriptional regulator [Cupriavidus gilardii J11]